MAGPLPPFAPPAPRSRSSSSDDNDNDQDHLSIQFRHPAYPSTVPALLVLPATDNDGRALDFHIALAACGIVAGTPPGGGYLALRDGDAGFVRQNRPPDGLLREKEYLFCLEGHEPLYKYPVIPSFHHWRFPHGNLPAPWHQLRIPAFRHSRGSTLKQHTTAATVRDGSCRISAYTDAIECAHLIPSGEKGWFVSNRMHEYCCSPVGASPTDDEANVVMLRRDLHYLFDTRRFTFIPKYFESFDSDPQPVLVTHVLLPTYSPELLPLYHNRTPQPIAGISPEFLFARFAWSIFIDEHVPFFLASNIEYTVQLWDDTKGTADTRTVRGFGIQAHARIFIPEVRSQSRNGSTKKRSLSTQERQRVEEEEWLDGGNFHLYNGEESNVWGRYDEEAIESIEAGGHGLNPDPWELEEVLTRGRPRKRTWDTMVACDGGGDIGAHQVPSLSSSFSLAAGPGEEAQLPPTLGLAQQRDPAPDDKIAPLGHSLGHAKGAVHRRPRKGMSGERVNEECDEFDTTLFPNT